MVSLGRKNPLGDALVEWQSLDFGGKETKMKVIIS